MNTNWIDYLQNEGAVFNDGRVAHFGGTTHEAATLLCDLSHQGLILISGDDAASFLHNQLSNDVNALNEGDAQWTSWCSPKGRMLVTPLLWRGRQGYFMQLPRAMQAAIQKRLQMFVLRAKAKLEDVSADWIKIGVAGDGANANIHAVFGAVPEVMKSVHNELGRVIRLSATRFEIIANVDNAKKIWQQLSASSTKVGAGAWDLLAIRDGVIEVLPETQDQFVPQMANLELIGGVSFKKGCYPGQEIVARTQYRGILKRRTVRVIGQSDEMLKPGESVYAAEFGDQAAGHIANVAGANGGFEALVVAQIESIKSDSLKLASGLALKIAPLPYDVTFP